MLSFDDSIMAAVNLKNRIEVSIHKISEDAELKSYCMYLASILTDIQDQRLDTKQETISDIFFSISELCDYIDKNYTRRASMNVPVLFQ